MTRKARRKAGKVLLVLFLATALLALVFCLFSTLCPSYAWAGRGWWNIFAALQEASLTENTDAEGLIKESVSQRPAPEVIVLLESLLLDKSADAGRDLMSLAQREDVVGYLANLTLAERSPQAAAAPDIYYRRALALYDTNEVRFKLAAWLVQDGQNQEAVVEYLALLPAREARAALSNLAACPIAVGRALVRGKHWPEAVEYISDILDNNDLPLPERLELVGALGQSYAQLGDYAQALPYLKEAFEGGCKGTIWWYARALESAGAITEAVSLYTELGAAGAYRLGLIFYEQGKKEKAALTLARSDSPEALWRGAMLWEELARLDQAVEIYQILARGESRYRDDAAFRAYTLMQRDGLPGADEMLEILLDVPAWSMRLTGEAHWEPADSPDYTIPQFIRFAEALHQSGRREWAEIETAIGQARAKPADLPAIGEWHLAQGDYFRATRFGIRSLNAQKTRRGYLLAYLRPFESIVLEAAAKYKLEPHLIWAVMREESHFRPEAVSPVGAIGLMQIMPATGLEIARRMGININSSDLLRPEVNIKFGAFYLRKKLDLFAGDMDKALAAYNGGQGNVRRWSRSPLGATPADFPSVITFFETREYITKVLNSYYTYNWLYGASDHIR